MRPLRSSVSLAAVLVAPLLACGGAGHVVSDAGARTPEAGPPRAPDAAPDVDAAPAPPDAPPEAPPSAVPEAGVDTTPDASDALPEGAPPRHALAVTLGDQHACVLRGDHKVSCWGHGVSAAPDSRPGRPARALAAGGPDTCAILDDGTVTCWAPALAGTATFSPELGAGRHVVDLAMNGHAWACAALDDGSATCWNRGWEGGAPPMTKTLPAAGAARIRRLVLNFGNETMALYEDGTVSPSLIFHLYPGRLIDGHTATSIASSGGGSWSWCATLSGGGVRCVGSNSNISPPNTAALTALAMGDNFTCGLRADGTVACWGFLMGCDDGSPATSYWCQSARNADGSHDVALGQAAVSLAASAFDEDVCAVLVDGSVRCWGGAAASCTVVDDVVVGCQAPEHQDELIGTSVDIVQTSAGRAYGAWHAIDLGALP